MPTPALWAISREGAGDAAAGRIAQDVDVRAGGEHRLDQAVERRGVAGDFGFEFEAFAHGHDGDAVHGDLAAEENFVAGPGARWGRCSTPSRDHADAGGVDEDSVGLAAIDDFGVAGDERDARGVGGFAHRVHDSRRNRRIGSPFLEDESDGEMQRARAAHGEVVDRAVDGEFADVAAGEKDRADHVGVGAEGEAGAVRR